MNRDALIGGGGTAAIGATYLMQSLGYRIGTPAVMGPGFFPTILSALLLLLGIAIACAPVSASAPAQSDERRSALAVIAAILAFALLIERAGAIPATIALVFISGLAAPVFRPMQLAAICVVMVGFIYGVFIQLLHLPISAWLLSV